MKAQVGEYDILESGTIVSINDMPLTLFIGDSMNIKFIFLDDDKDPQISFGLENSKMLNVILNNFNMPTGVGNSSLIKLGTYGEDPERELHLNFMVYGHPGESKNKVLNYTFLLGQVVLPS